MEWVASDFASWLAVLIALGAAMLAWKVARAASYIEFHPGWGIHIDDNTGDVEIKGRVTIVSNAAYVSGKGKLIFGRWKKNIIWVQFSKATPHLMRRNEVSLEFTGKTDLKFPKPRPGKFELAIRLSDGTIKRLKGDMEVEPSSTSDKVGSESE